MLFDSISRLMPRGVLVLFAISAVAALGGAEEWEPEALLLYNSSSPEINDLRARSTGNERLRRYAKALGMLHRQPVREEDALLAKLAFDKLLDVNPNDDVGIASAYYLARISHRHLDRPDIESAREAYHYLFENFPRRFFGELAFLKYLLLEFYGSDARESPGDRLSRLEGLGDRLVIPDMRRGYHRSIGDAYLTYDLSKTKAYEHLKLAYDIDTSVPETQLDLILKVAELAELHGDLGVAIGALNKFLKVTRRDERRSDVEVRLTELRRQLVN
jgi:hypothetical protein